MTDLCSVQFAHLQSSRFLRSSTTGPDVQGLKIIRRPISGHVQNEPDKSHFLEKVDRDRVAECTSRSNAARSAGDDGFDIHQKMAPIIMPCKVCP
jgi:hypothetical protein